MMRRVRMMIAVTLLIASTTQAKGGLDASTAAGQVTVDSRLIDSLPMRQLGVNWYFQDVHAAPPMPSGGGPINPFGGSVIGLGASYRQRFNTSSQWFYTLDGGYGIGDQKQEFTFGTSSFSDKVNFKSWYGRGGFGYEMPITTRGRIYGDCGLFHSSTTGKFDNGTLSEDGKPWNVWGIDKAFGGSVDLSPKVSLYGELYSQFGWGSAKDGSSKFNSTVKYGCYRGGLLWRL